MAEEEEEQPSSCDEEEALGADSSDSEADAGQKASGEAAENPIERQMREAEERRIKYEKLEKKIAKQEMKMAKEAMRQQKKKKKKAKKRRHEESDDEDDDDDNDDASHEEFWTGLEETKGNQKTRKPGRGKGKKRAKESPEEATETKAPKPGPKARAKKRTKEADPEEHAADSQLEGAAQEKLGNEANSLEKAPKRGRRGKKAGDEAVNTKEDTKARETAEAASSTQGQGRRGKKGGEDGGRQQREEGVDSLLDWGDDLEEPDEAVLQSWQQELAQRRDSGSMDDRTVFSMKERGSMLRSLKPECFLGGKRLEEGGHLLYDDEGKVNLHFLLATVKTATASGAPTALRPASAHRSKLRWLAAVALDMRLIGKQELKRGKVQAKRMEQARKNGNYSLLLESNLVVDRRTEDADGLPEANAASGGMAFPERAAAEGSTDSNRAGRQTVFSTLRSQAVQRQAKIITSSSHQLDLQKVQALIGPSFSFDWEAKGDGEEDELEVDIPESDKKSSGRNIMKDQLQRSVSFRQLSKSIHSSQSLGAVSTASTPTASQDLAESLPAPPSSISGGALARRVARRGEVKEEKQVAKEQSAAKASTVPSTSSASTSKHSAVKPAATAEAKEVEAPQTSSAADAAQVMSAPAESSASLLPPPPEEEAREQPPEPDLPDKTTEAADPVVPPFITPGEDPNLCATQPLPEEAEERPPHDSDETAAGAAPSEPVQLEEPAAVTAAVRKEVIISPTLPFEPAAPPELPPPPARKVPVEISPTLPFEPQVAEPEEEPPSRAGAIQAAGVVAPEQKASSRSAENALETQDLGALHNTEIEDLMEEDDLEEAETEADRRRAAQEREWLKHKRRLELQKQAALHEQSAVKKQAVAGKSRLGSSSMSAEEKSRYQALVSDMPTPAAEVNDGLLGSLRAPQTAVQRKPSFVALLAKKFSRSASDRSLAGAGA